MAEPSTQMDVRVETDEHGLPVVSWLEPQREDRTWFVFNWKAFPKYPSRCWIGIDGKTGEPTFAFRHDKYHGKPDTTDFTDTPLSNITGFTLYTKSELFGNGTTPLPVQDPNIERYRDNLILAADLKQPLENVGYIYFPMTATTAPRSEVMKLHAVLTETFLVNIDALKPALKARKEKWKLENKDKRWNAFLKPPMISGGRKFVDIWDRYPFSKKKHIRAVNDEPSFEQFSDHVEGGTRSVFYWHFFERGQNGVAERWMACSGFYIYSPADTQYPELLQFTRAGLEGWASGYKPRKLFKAVRLFDGSELQLPGDYFAAPDVRIDASTLILCMEFSDGELMALTQAPASERAGVERLRGRLEYAFSSEGEGTSKIIL